MHRLVYALLLALLTGGCAVEFPRPETLSDNQLEARRLLDASIAAHGGYLFEREGQIDVAYDGQWRRLIKRIQPLIVDENFRSSSQESLDLQTGRLEQLHRGPGGEKRVVRTSEAVSVSYNGAPDEQSQDVLDAAALVADAYALFLTGPSFLRWRGAELSMLDAAERDGRRYDRIHAVISPGFGFSERDEAVLWIDRETRLLHLAHFTLDGVATTQGAHVDVIFDEFETIDGYLWPTRFRERVRGPFRIDAHLWETQALRLRPRAG